VTGLFGGDLFGGASSGGDPLGAGAEDPTCSRAGCRESAHWNVNWRNPRIHGEERVKVWRACDAHRDYLTEYLRARDFPVLTTEVGVAVVRVPSL